VVVARAARSVVERSVLGDGPAGRGRPPQAAARRLALRMYRSCHNQPARASHDRAVQVKAAARCLLLMCRCQAIAWHHEADASRLCERGGMDGRGSVVAVRAVPGRLRGRRRSHQRPGRRGPAGRAGGDPARRAGAARVLQAGQELLVLHRRRHRYHHQVELAEEEHLQPNAVMVDGVELVPYAYEERAEHGAIVIDLKARMADPARTELQALITRHSEDYPSYFPVLRRGLQETPRTMRFGKCTWSAHDGEFKNNIILVEDAYDRSEPEPLVGWNYPEALRTREMAARTSALVTELLRVLEARRW
jgi:hypothetical protein